MKVADNQVDAVYDPDYDKADQFEVPASGLLSAEDPERLDPEFVGGIIDIFDDFLEEHNVRVPSSDKAMEADGDDPGDARLYGADHDELVDALTTYFLGSKE